MELDLYKDIIIYNIAYYRAIKVVPPVLDRFYRTACIGCGEVLRVANIDISVIESSFSHYGNLFVVGENGQGGSWFTENYDASFIVTPADFANYDFSNRNTRINLIKKKYRLHIDCIEAFRIMPVL